MQQHVTPRNHNRNTALELETFGPHEDLINTGNKHITIKSYNETKMKTQGNNVMQHLGPVFQSIINLTSSLKGQLVKFLAILKPNTLKFFVEKMREACKSFSHFFQQKILAYLRY